MNTNQESQKKTWNKSPTLLMVLLFLIVAVGVTAKQFYQSNGKMTAVAVNKESKGIQFIENQWDTALKKAKKENKFLFVDAYATWCVPCKLMKMTTFKNKETAAYFNEHFINVSQDVEKGQGPDLARQWSIQGLPTLLVFDPSGKPVLQSVGLLRPKELLAFGQQALKH